MALKGTRIPQEQLDALVRNLQGYFLDERGEEIGELAARNLLDFMEKQLGPLIYNQAVADARTVVLQQAERIEDELYLLEQPLNATRRDG